MSQAVHQVHHPITRFQHSKKNKYGFTIKTNEYIVKNKYCSQSIGHLIGIGQS